MEIYNVALGVSGTWHGVTIPRGVGNIEIRPTTDHPIFVRQPKDPTDTFRATVDSPFLITNRDLREVLALQIMCNTVNDVVASVTVW